MSAAPLRLHVDRDALCANWRWLAAASGRAATGAAVKANGYGTGAVLALTSLARAGCRDFFVATWAEAEALLPHAQGLNLYVLHGLLPDESALPGTIPVLNSTAQIARWRAQADGRACALMFDTGMNRLGLSAQDVAACEGLHIAMLLSHLASADEPDNAQNARQLKAFTEINLPQVPRSLANSAGICLGKDYHFDLTRPGLGLYGGLAHPAAAGHIRQVVRVEAAVLQRRHLAIGDSIGYGATWQAKAPTEVAILNLGYADGYLRGFSSRGQAFVGGAACPVIGRVSMDLTAIDVSAAPQVQEGDWVEVDYDLPRAALASGLSQYELLTSLGGRYAREI